MKNIYSEIIQWASEQSYWEQVALDKIFSGNALTDDDYDELLQYLLEDKQLVEKEENRVPPRFKHGNIDKEDGDKILLKEIRELENVNALVPNQKLTFNQSLTAIFGRNGSGKSGYARILGSAGFTRGDQDVLPDITKPFDENQPIKATIEVTTNGVEKSVLHEVGKRCPELSSFYVFDSTSVQVHMTGKNSFSFSPAGLSVLTELSRVTDEVRGRLKNKIISLEEPGDFEMRFPGESEILDLIKNLNADSNLQQLRELAELTDRDRKRIHKLEVEIGNIGLGQHRDEIEQKKSDLETLVGLHKWLIRAHELLSSQKLLEINEKISKFQELQARARDVSVERFRHDNFTQTGTELWDEFIQKTHQLAQEESRAREAYPQEDDVCLLCQQTLSEDSRKLILQLWSYLVGEIRVNLSRIETELVELYEEIKRNDEFSLFQDHSISLALLGKEYPELSKRTERQANDLVARGESFLSAIKSCKVISPANEVSGNCIQEILTIIQDLEKFISEREKLDFIKRIENLELERRTLEHRKILKEALPDIEKYINQRIWAKKAAKAGGSTRHITRKFNDLFDRLVKNRYIEIFENTLSNLGRSLQVEIITSGRKGETVKQIQLKAHQTAEDIADPEKILSEGEKRAVALADFLTEAALDTTSSGIVLDDPVTSLDLEWRKTIAEILAKETENRQVIVFTHDMPFLYQLLKYSDDMGIDRQVHWIKRGDVDDLPGYVHNNNCPALEQEYKSSQPARDFYSLAKQADTAKVQEALTKEGMAALRTSYEALVVYELFGGVVTRFEERISIGRLTGLVWDDGILKEIDQNYSRLSRYIEGHLRSDALAEPIKVDMLRSEFEIFDDLKKRIKNLKKAKSKE